MFRKSTRSLILVLLFLSLLPASCRTKKNTIHIQPKKEILILKPITNDEYVHEDTGSYRINSASIKDQILNIEISYKGGCGEHIFELVWNGRYLKSFPIQIPVFIKHTIENEKCDIDQLISVNYDLSEIVPSLQDTVYINLATYNDKLLYVTEKK